MKSSIASNRSDHSPNEHKSLAFNWSFRKLPESAIQGFWKGLAFTLPVSHSRTKREYCFPLLAASSSLRTLAGYNAKSDPCGSGSPNELCRKQHDGSETQWRVSASLLSSIW